MLCVLRVLCGFILFVITLEALAPDVIRSSGAVPAHIAGQFREPVGFQQSSSGQYFVFDRRAHTVYGLDAQMSSAWTIVTIGGESGKIIDPTAFAVEPNGTFIVADDPDSYPHQAIDRDEWQRVTELQNAYIAGQEMIVVDG